MRAVNSIHQAVGIMYCLLLTAYCLLSLIWARQCHAPYLTLTPCDSRDYTYLVTVFDRGVLVLLEADILIIDIEVYKPS